MKGTWSKVVERDEGVGGCAQGRRWRSLQWEDVGGVGGSQFFNIVEYVWSLSILCGTQPTQLVLGDPCLSFKSR